MKSEIVKYSFMGLALAACCPVSAQEPNPMAAGQQQTAPAAGPQGTYENTPLYRIQVVGRELTAINYFHHSGVTRIGFEGTSLLPDAHGQARVRAENGRTVIDATFDRLTPANSFGPEYLTYVLWAITPQGRPINLGEVLPSGKQDKDQITVTTDLQAFGLIVTAEPYYAVTMPSDVVVAQNDVLKGQTQGVIEQVNVHYSLLPRGAYEVTAGRHAVLHPIKTDMRSPLELYEAENAVGIAAAGGAGTYAQDSMASAQQALSTAEDYNKHKRDRKDTITYAREAVQSAEDARIITIRKLEAQDEAAQKQARAQAEQAATQAQQAEQQQAAQRAAAEQNAQQAQEQAQQAQQQAAAAQQEQQQAEQATAQARQEQQQAEQQTAAARQAQQQAEQQTAAARQAQQQAEQNAQQLGQQAEQARERLRQQLSQILQTHETARGLIMNMSDVVFGFNKYDLKPDAEVKLAKISGILLAYPDLKVQVEGYTDNVGSAQYNETLSNERAESVRDFLVQQNVPTNEVSAQGYGGSDPVASNDSSQGRAANRRVELVVSGAAIGIEGGQPPAQPEAQPGQSAQPDQNPPQEPQAPAAATGSSNPQ